MPLENGIIVPHPSAPKEPAKPISPFMYRVIKVPSNDVEDPPTFMPQRGLVTEEGHDMWFDGVPQAAPTLELARVWVISMMTTDLRKTDGDVCWVPSFAE